MNKMRENAASVAAGMIARVVTSVVSWWNDCRLAMHLRRQHRLEVSTCLQSAHDVQLKEFDDSVYICLNGVPLIHSEQLKSDIVETLHEARMNYQRYLMRDKMSEEQKYDDMRCSF